jgi:transcriptional regulator with XRE-family HTH domain
MPDTADRIGAAIRDARVGAGLTQTELGAFVGVDRFAIAQLENGRFTAQGRRLFDVLDALGMEIEVVRRSGRLAADATDATPADGAR